MGARQVPRRHHGHETLDLLQDSACGDGAGPGPPDGDIPRAEKRRRDGDLLPREHADADVLQRSLDVHRRQHVQREVAVDVVEDDVALDLGEVGVGEDVLLHDELVEALRLREGGLVAGDADDLAGAEGLGHEGGEPAARARGPEDQHGEVLGEVRGASLERQPAADGRVDAGGELHRVDALGDGGGGALVDGDELGEGPEAGPEVGVVVELAGGDVAADAVDAHVVGERRRRVRVVLAGGAGADDLVEAGRQDAELDLGIGGRGRVVDGHVLWTLGPVADLNDMHCEGLGVVGCG